MKKRVIDLPVLSSGVSLVDTHCHLDMEAFKGDLEELLQRATSNKVEHIVTIGIDLQSSLHAAELAAAYQNISATVGIHPHDVDAVTTATYDKIGEIADTYSDYIVGYGEIGLDYVKEYSHADNQRLHFANQLALAKELRLPVVVHDREAHDDTLRILRQAGTSDFGGVMHCFSGDCQFAEKVLELGFYISIPGVVTFKNALDLQEVARTIPLERMLIETDGPFLSPHPLRGKRNEPVNVLYTADFIARLRDMSLDEVARQTTANAEKLFKLRQN